MSQVKTHATEVQKKTEPARQLEQEVTRQPEQEPVQLVAPQAVYRRTQMNRNRLRPEDLLALQRTVGNRMVQRIMALPGERANDEHHSNLEQKDNFIIISQENAPSLARTQDPASLKQTLDIQLLSPEALEQEIDLIRFWLKENASNPERVRLKIILSKLQYELDLRLSQRTPGLLSALLPAHTQPYYRDPSDRIRDPYLKFTNKTAGAAFFGAANLGRNLVASVMAADLLALLAICGFVEIVGAGAITAGAAELVSVAGSEFALAGGALKAAGSTALSFYLSNVIMVNELGLLGAGLVMSVDGDVVGFLKALPDNPKDALFILAQIWMIHASVQTPRGEINTERISARLLPPNQQTDPRHLRLEIVDIQSEVSAIAPKASSGKVPSRGATSEGIGESFNYKYLSEVEPPKVEYKPVRPQPRNPAIEPEDAIKSVRNTKPNSPNTKTTPDDIRDVLDEATEGTAFGNKSSSEPDVLNLPNPKQVEEITSGTLEGQFSSISKVWEPPPGSKSKPSLAASRQERLKWLKERLRIHVDQAIERFEVEGLTPRQEADIERANTTHRGSRIDHFAKDSVLRDPELADIITAPDFVKEPDILDSVIPDWFDITTKRSWSEHLKRYQASHGTAAHLLETQRNNE